jgi:hypothetical protein
MRLSTFKSLRFFSKKYFFLTFVQRLTLSYPHEKGVVEDFYALKTLRGPLSIKGFFYDFFIKKAVPMQGIETAFLVKSKE